MLKLLIIITSCTFLNSLTTYCKQLEAKNIASHKSHAEKFEGMRNRLLNYRMKRLAYSNKGLLVCLFVLERHLDEPDFVELRLLSKGKSPVIIPINEVKSYPVPSSSSVTNKQVVLSVMYAEIPLLHGSYDIEVHDRIVKFFKDTKIDPGRVSIVTHVANLSNSRELEPNLVAFYKDNLYQYLLKYESFMHSVNYELEKPGLQYLLLDLTLDFNESFHRPISKIDLSKVELVNDESEVIDSLVRENDGFQYTGTQTVRVYERETTYSHYQLAFRFLRLAGTPANKCLNMVLDASLLRQDITQTQRLKLGRNGKITLYDVFCSKESKRQDFDHTRLDIKAQRQRDGVWKVVRKTTVSD